MTMPASSRLAGPGVDFVGTITRVHEVAGGVILSVKVDGVEGTFAFRPGDLVRDFRPSLRTNCRRSAISGTTEPSVVGLRRRAGSVSSLSSRWSGTEVRELTLPARLRR
jgi:hypothetical protein